MTPICLIFFAINTQAVLEKRNTDLKLKKRKEIKTKLQQKRENSHKEIRYTIRYHTDREMELKDLYITNGRYH